LLILQITSAPQPCVVTWKNSQAKLLRALGVKGPEAELQSASDEFSGHCLGLALLGGYLTDAYNGDIRCRKEVSERLGYDVRQGIHARKVMESYQSWFGEGPELSVLRMLGLFDRPADEKALGALLKPPAIPGLTESLTDLSPTEWRTILARLRRARLLAGEDPHKPGDLDTHPLVREYFGEQLRSQQKDAWKECNRRLYNYYRTLAPRLPDSFREMEPLFLAVICGCNAGLFGEALHEVYIPLNRPAKPHQIRIDSEKRGSWVSLPSRRPRDRKANKFRQISRDTSPVLFLRKRGSTLLPLLLPAHQHLAKRFQIKKLCWM
jgi:hypothetical protein